MNRFIVTINKFMCNLIPMFLVIAMLLAVFSVSRANDTAGASVQQPTLVDELAFDGVDLTAQRFFKAYMSRSADERKSAEFYLLGVLDATEGKSWCGYQTFKSITLGETVFLGFKKLNSRQFNERASTVIADVLSQSYPCRRAK